MLFRSTPDVRGKGGLAINAAAVLNALLLSGNDGNNALVATAFADRLQGRLGNDTLTGGAGADVFRGSGTTGSPLAASAFRAGAGVGAAALASDRILLNTSTGLLAYDADGTGKTAAVAFAQIPTTIAPLEIGRAHV